MNVTLSPMEGRSARYKNTMGLAKVLFVLIGVPLIAVGVVYIYEEGYLGFYWERYESIYDPQLKTYRCIDENGELAETLEYPCLVVTQQGQKAQARLAKNCEIGGGEPEKCQKDSYDWLISTQPRTK